MQKENIVDLADKSALNKTGLKLIVSGIAVALISLLFSLNIKLPSLPELSLTPFLMSFISHVPFEFMFTSMLGLMILFELFLLYKGTLWSNIPILKRTENSDQSDRINAITLLVKDILKAKQVELKYVMVQLFLSSVFFVCIFITLISPLILPTDIFASLLSSNFTKNSGYILWWTVLLVLSMINIRLDYTDMLLKEGAKPLTTLYGFSYEDCVNFHHQLTDESGIVAKVNTKRSYLAPILAFSLMMAVIVMITHHYAVKAKETTEPLVFGEDVSLPARFELLHTIESKVLTEKINKDFAETFNEMGITQLGCLDYSLRIHDGSLHIYNIDSRESNFFAMRNHSINEVSNACIAGKYKNVNLLYKIYKHGDQFIVRVGSGQSKKHAVEDIYPLIKEQINNYIANVNEQIKNAQELEEAESKRIYQY